MAGTLVACEYRGPRLPGDAGTRRVKCCRGHSDVHLPVYECKLGNTGHGGADGLTWRDCRTYRNGKGCTPETCLPARMRAKDKANG